ncbi:helix-turn-helix domain-containing protein [Streptomyces sp. NPDC005930]|uniref:helix-turn-helix domain-containing protein n=1 Tax=Streptomyces sp. NPDC005930 TaxID=3364736 RepID=UPI0036B7B276
MSAQEDGDGIDDVAEFAALLRALKERTDRSYGSLARRLGMNTSTLHRYCAGDAVPLDFAPAERFAALCGATPEQRLELHHRWLRAVAARHRPRTAGTGASGATAANVVDGAADEPDTAVADVTEPGTARAADGGPGAAPDTAPKVTGSPGTGADPAPGAPPAPAPRLPSRLRYGRGRLVVALASVGAALATLVALSVRPDEGPTSSDGPARLARPTASRATESGAAERRSASPSPSGTPTPGTSERRSGSATAPGTKPGTSPSPGATSAPRHSEQPAGLPLAWSVDSHAWKLGCGHDYVIAKPPGQVPPPPAPQDAAPWAATQNAVHGGETLVQLSVQGRSDTAVVLEALRVRVVGRTAPAEGNAYAMDQGCGGSITPRSFAVDLDKDRPVARAVAGNDAGTPIPAVRMPYRVSAKDPEVLLVTAGTSACDCRWYLELDWSSQGRTGTVRIDDGGRPFRTSAITGLPRYVYDTLARRWGPYS